MQDTKTYEKAQQRTVGCVKRQAGAAITFSPRAQTPVNIDHSDESAGMYLCHARGARLHASMRYANNNVGWWHAVVHTTQARRRQQLAKKAISRGVNLAGSSETIRKISCICCPSRSSSDGWRSIGCGVASCHWRRMACMHVQRACIQRRPWMLGKGLRRAFVGTNYFIRGISTSPSRPWSVRHTIQAQVRKYRAEIGSRTSAYDKSYDCDFAFPCRDKDTFSHLAT